MLTGQYSNTFDEKGRLLIPSKIRNELAGDKVIVTSGVDKCLWVYHPAEWEKVVGEIMSSTSQFQSKARLLQRRIIAPAVECDIDSAGRIRIPQPLRESAGLSKNAMILGIMNYIEIWDPEQYNSYLDESESQYLEAAELLGDVLASRNGG
ncbi:MAG: division/cell wall cluster transcriptional repressor MraZ [Spirochaetales bacterium]|nr:division/cell wall cluster transcriptional repressor MraZ [Spirochaetales bacterium]